MTWLRERRFASQIAWTAAVRQVVARTWPDAGGVPSIAFSGGSTPARYLPALRRAPVDWPATIATLTDDRCVSPLAQSSNEGLLRRNLQAGTPRGPTLAPLVRGPKSYSEQRRRDEAVAGLLPLDLVLLGMGADGHVASLFPERPDLWGASTPTVRFRRDCDPYDRVSLSLWVLASARRLAIVFAGADKWQVWRQAREPGADTPVAALLGARADAGCANPVEVLALAP